MNVGLKDNTNDKSHTQRNRAFLYQFFMQSLRSLPLTLQHYGLLARGPLTS